MVNGTTQFFPRANPFKILIVKLKPIGYILDMQFLLVAHDHKKRGLQRRLAVREQHVKLGDQMKAEGKYLMGVALLDENNQMKGSVMVLDFPSRKELDEYLKTEPYVIHDVWEKIEILPCKVGPTFMK